MFVKSCINLFPQDCASFISAKIPFYEQVLKKITPLFQGDQHRSVSVNALHKHVIMGTDNKVTPFHACDKQLPLHLPIIRMTFLQFVYTMVSSEVPAVNVAYCIWSFYFNQAK